LFAGIYPTKDELYLFFKRYDRDNDGLLKFSEYVDLITPSSPEYASLSRSRVPNYLNPDDGLINFTLETRRLYKKLLNKVLQSEVEAEYIRQKLSRRPLFSLYDAFLAIDSQDNGFITLDGFRNIL
jgi:Ca2+-binding EF-hand superfamily protein